MEKYELTAEEMEEIASGKALSQCTYEENQELYSRYHEYNNIKFKKGHLAEYYAKYPERYYKDQKKPTNIFAPIMI